MPRSIWNGVITFGLVTMPVKLYTATENHDVSFHQLHDKCDTRIKYQKYCPNCDKTVDNDELEKGYEFARGQYVVLTEDDFEKLPLPSKHAIQVSAFVDSAEINPVYFEKAYYVEPGEAALRPFNLFMKALSEMGVVAVATLTLRNKERLCALRPVGGTLVLDTLLYPDEVRIGESTDTPEVKVSDKELQMAQHLIELMRQPFDPVQYKDHYREALKEVIDAKLAGKEIVAEEEPPRARVVDLMDALRASVERAQPGKKNGRAGAKKAEQTVEPKPRRRARAPKTTGTKSRTKTASSRSRKSKKSA